MFGKNLKKLREDLKISQRELGRRIGKTGQYISYLENTESGNPSLDVIKKISEALNITTNELIGNKKTGIQEIIEELLDSGITIEQISEKTNIPIDDIESLANGLELSEPDYFDRIVNTFYGSFYEYMNTSPRQIIKRIAQENRKHEDAINGLYTTLSSYYKITLNHAAPEHFIQLHLNNETITYTKDDFNKFLDFVAASFPSFKIITEYHKNKK